MSFIDVWAHEYVASFAGLPVYHPLASISGEITAGPDTLLLGGGSGEHPALVIHNLEQVAGYYIADVLEKLAHPGEPDEGIFDRSTILSDPVMPYDCLDFVEWNVEDQAAFHERCTSTFMASPYKRGAPFAQLEGWLVYNFGQLICLSLPDIVPALEGDLAEAWSHARKYMDPECNFVSAPPGYPVRFGRHPKGSIGDSYSAWEPAKRNKA